MKLLFACCIAGNPLVLLGQVQAVDLGLSVKWADRNLGSVENKQVIKSPDLAFNEFRYYGKQVRAVKKK